MFAENLALERFQMLGGWVGGEWVFKNQSWARQGD